MDAAILRPLRIVPVSSVPPQSGETTSFVDLSAHSLLMPTHVLSDMIVLFQTGQEEAKKVSLEAPPPSALGQPRSRSGTGSETRKKLSRYNHVLHKLEFYVAHVLATPSGIMENVSDAVLNWSRRVQAECWNTNIVRLVNPQLSMSIDRTAGTFRESSRKYFVNKSGGTAHKPWSSRDIWGSRWERMMSTLLSSLPYSSCS